VREWVEGILGNEWAQKWIAGGCDMSDTPLVHLFHFFDSLAKRGIYLMNLKGENMVWSDDKWVVIDYGGVRRDISYETAKNVRF
jgi:hypothetical protein